MCSLCWWNYLHHSEGNIYCLWYERSNVFLNFCTLSIVLIFPKDLFESQSYNERGRKRQRETDPLSAGSLSRCPHACQWAVWPDWSNPPEPLPSQSPAMALTCSGRCWGLFGDTTNNHDQACPKPWLPFAPVGATAWTSLALVHTSRDFGLIGVALQNPYRAGPQTQVSSVPACPQPQSSLVGAMA